MVNRSTKPTKNIPPISIVMPLYNKADDVKSAISSVLRQTFDDFELIVVNDGSTDNSPDIVGLINDDRIRVIDQENSGVSAARNRGIEESHADLIAFLDADDEWKPTFLETIDKLKKKFPDCSVFATGYSYLHQDGTESRPVINGIPPHPWFGILSNYFYIASISDPPLCSSAVAIRKGAINAVGGFPVGVKSGEDLLTWAKLAVTCHIAYDTNSLSLFKQSASPHTPPTRLPEVPDKVGISLKELVKDVHPSKQKDLKHYLGWWHKSRANMYLRSGQRSKCLTEVMQMGYYHLNIIFFVYCSCLLLPHSLVQKLIFFRNKKRPKIDN